MIRSSCRKSHDFMSGLFEGEWSLQVPLLETQTFLLGVLLVKKLKRGKSHNFLEKVVLQKTRDIILGAPTCPILVASCRYIWSAIGLGTIKALENEKNEVEKLRQRVQSLGFFNNQFVYGLEKKVCRLKPLRHFLGCLGPIVFL